jgi:asparagine synthase (glutamine-hydrolysing)
MCGIAGTFGGSQAEVEAMMRRIAHRGPDGSGVYAAGNTIHGHVRLALLDLTEASSQPFLRGATCLSFNGEIWNFQELRKQLEAQDQVFRTSGDTEVLAATLQTLGLVKGAQALDGMFAFAWTDADNRSWLVRDAFGKIPLYLAKRGASYYWASERKAFPKGLQPIAVPPGYAFCLNSGQWLKWYSLPPATETTPLQVLQQLRAGIKKRLTADAPVCCLISGGLDSSLILALAKEVAPSVTAFTAVFQKDSEDAQSARRLCSDLQVPLVEVPVVCSSESIAKAICSIEIASKAQIEIAVLCLPLAAAIAERGFKACLSGEAADELFGGYGNFCIKAASATEAQIKQLRLDSLAKMSRGNFVRCNKAFMAAGVECRLPFMEQELVESVIQLGKQQSPPGKVLLKQAAEGVLPRWIVKRNKDTFQGGSGISEAVSRQIANPIKFYNTELKKQYGYLPKD